MEPPSHNSLSKDWLPTLEERNKGALALDKLSDELKKFVDRHAGGGDEVFGKVDFMTGASDHIPASKENAFELSEATLVLAGRARPVKPVSQRCKGRDCFGTE